MKSYRIWNYGDFEIFHSNLIHTRREELGAEVPAFWKFYDVDRNVIFVGKFTTQKDGGALIYNNKEYTLKAGETLEIFAD